MELKQHHNMYKSMVSKQNKKYQETPNMKFIQNKHYIVYIYPKK